MKKSQTFQLKSLPGTIVIAMLGACGLAATATAQVRTWTTTTPAGDTGNWSDSAKWSGTDVPDTAGESAVFGGYANDRTVTANTDAFVIDGLTIIPRTTGFSAKNFTLNASGGGSLQLGSGGLIIGNGGTTTLSLPIALTADQIWTTNTDTAAGSVSVSGVISGAFKLTRNANFSLPISFTGPNTFSGGFVNNSGNAITRVGLSSIVTSGVIESGPLGTGTITLNAGTLSSNGGTARTFHNNLSIGGTIALGRSGDTGTLTFTDLDLSSPSTFSLASATSGNVANIRVGASINLDQVIAESGGSNQGILFSAISGTPTVTLNRTKTAGGPVLAGGVNLVLANGLANTGSLVGVNGSITATGANKFSAGSLVVDGTNLVATDASNYSAIEGGTATVFNNGRVSFATDQNQATLAGLITSDSQVRIGLGSGSGSATVTENYNQSTLGNGKAGLVSASTGTITYSGILTAGSDSTYRVGGGIGTLALTNALTGTGGNLIVEGGGTLTSNADNTFTGTTTVNSSATLTGSNGMLSATSAVTVNNGATLTLSNNTATENANRIGNSVGITLNSGLFQLSGTSTTAASETVGNLTINSGGRNFITVATTPAAATVKTLQFGTLTRANNALAIFRGDTLGTTATARNEIRFSASPTLTGGGGAPASTNISILPWARGGTAAANSATGFVTYEANGIRRLDATTEFIQAGNTTTIDAAVSPNADRNVRVTSAVTTGSSTVNGAAATPTVNSLIFDNTGATGAQTFNLGGGTVTVSSGAVHVQQGVGQNLTIGSGTLAFGSAEGVITANSNGFLTTIGATLTGSNGISIYNVNGGGISLATTNSFSGGLTIGGNGYVAADQDVRLGAAGGSVTHGGGTLQFFSGFTTTRDLILLGGVGDNTLANNSAFTHTWNGIISGAGRLRLTNNASTASTVGYVLGGNNSYTGGTQIEGITVVANTDSSFGTGTVSLLGGSFGAGTITFTSAAPAIGGLRGSGGTVTINPSGSAATLTIGAANENGLFAGNLTQGAGKTGSIEKTGTGKLILTGNNSYTGNTTVTAGTLSFSQPRFDDASIVNVSTAATLELTHGGTDVVGEFQINGVTQTAGIYGAIGSGAPIETPRITGNGRIQSTTGPSADPYEDWADDNSLAGLDRDKTADPDKDGMTNLVEFAIDGNPNSGAADGKSRSQIETISGEEALVLTIPVLDGAVFDNVPGPSSDATVGTFTYIIEGSNDLITFDQGVTEIDPALDSGLVSPTAGWSHRSFRLNGNIGGGTPRGPKGFLRAKIVTAP